MFGEGWWLHADGRCVAIHEHLSDVLSDPPRFGLSPAAADHREGESSEVHRERVLKAVAQHGWIRVRRHRGNIVFEFWRLSRQGADAIWRFLTEEIAAEEMEIRLGNMRTGDVVRTNLARYRRDVRRIVGNPAIGMSSGGLWIYRLAHRRAGR